MTIEDVKIEELNLNAGKETKFVGSIDCGTTSCRFYIFSQWGEVITSHQIEFEQSTSYSCFYPVSSPR